MNPFRGRRSGTWLIVLALVLSPAAAAAKPEAAFRLPF